MLSCWDGLTDEQIAYNVGISRSTLNSWKDKYSDISDTLKRGKEVIDRQVENALLKRALGYEYTETTREYIPELDEMKTTKKVTKQVAPDTTAQIFWLKNRKPDKWRDKREVEDRSAVDKLDMILAEMKAVAELDQEKIEEGCIYDDKQSSDKMR
jgi:hypothetical protein